MLRAIMVLLTNHEIYDVKREFHRFSSKKWGKGRLLTTRDTAFHSH
jgi:hypothetical protein